VHLPDLDKPEQGAQLSVLVLQSLLAA
jgi:hypothetical protein